MQQPTPAPQKATLQTIANACGVARSTVSKALRNNPAISQETRERILLKAKELNYIPDPEISAFMRRLSQKNLRKNTETIAFVTAFPTAEEWKDIISFRAYYQGALKRCNELGFWLDEFWAGSIKWSGKRLSQILHARGIRGLMLAPAPSTVTRLDINWDDFSVIAFGYGFKDIPCHRVSNNQYRTVLKMLSRLDQLGYRRIGLMHSRSSDQNIINNVYAAISVYQSYLPQSLRIPPLMEHTPHFEGILSWVKENQIEVIVSTHPQTLELLEQAGLKIPDDLGLAVFSGIDLAPSNLAGADQNSYRIGMTAVELMAEQLYENRTGLPSYQKFVLVEGDWRDGETVRDLKRGPSLNWDQLL